MVGVRAHIKAFFDSTPAGWGSTYQARLKPLTLNP